MPPIQLIVGADRQPTFDQSLSQIQEFIDTSKFEIGRSLLMGMFDPASPFYIGNIATVMDGVNRSFTLANLSSSEVIQRMNSKEFNSKGSMKLSGSVITPEMFKIDELFNYIEIWRAFGTHLALKNDSAIPNEQNTLQFHDVFMDELLKRAHTDLRRIIIEGVKGTGTNAVEVLNGFTKICKDAVAANKLTPFSISGINSTNILEKIDDLVMKINPIQRWSPVSGIYVALDSINYGFLRKLALDKSTKLAEQSQANINNGSATQMYFTLPSQSTVRIYEEPFLPANAMYCTTKNNLVVGVDTQSFNLRAKDADREIKILGEGMISVGVREFNPANGLEKERMFACNEALVA